MQISGGGIGNGLYQEVEGCRRNLGTAEASKSPVLRIRDALSTCNTRTQTKRVCTSRNKVCRRRLSLRVFWLSPGNHRSGESRGVRACGRDCHRPTARFFRSRRSWRRDVTAMMALQLKNGDAPYYQSAEYCRNYTSPPVSYGDSSHYLTRLPGKERLAT